MKILFLYPSAESQLGFNYGVAHMAALLKRAGHDVAFWQLCEEIEPLPSEPQFLDRVAAEQPDILAFSVVTNQWAYTQRLARWARRKFSIPFVIGGIHTLMSTDEVLKTGLFDYVFRGECEEAFLEFVETFRRGQSVESVPNLAYRRDGQTRVNPVGPLHPQNHQLLDITGAKMSLLYDMPIPLGEPHYAVAIKAEKLHPVNNYKTGWNSRKDERSPHRARAGRERVERNGNAHVGGIDCYWHITAVYHPCYW